MSLIFIESFDSLTSSTLSHKWNRVFSTVSGAAPVVSTTYARKGNGVGIGQNSRIYKSIAQTTTLVVGFSFKLTQNYNAGIITGFLDNFVHQVDLHLSSSGQLSVRNGHGTILGTAVNTINLNTWYYIELKVTISNTTGSFTLRVNGSSVASGTLLDTQLSPNAYVDVVSLGGYALNGSQIWCFDDVYMLDTTGTRNIDFLGPVSVDVLYPNAAGFVSQWTALSGSNYTQVNEHAVDGDTSYVSAATNGFQDLYEFDDIRNTPGAIFGIQLNQYSRKEWAGVRTAAHLLRPGTLDSGAGGSVNYGGGTVYLTESYSYHSELYDTNPANSGAGTWTVSSVNGLQAGQTRVS